MTKIKETPLPEPVGKFIIDHPSIKEIWKTPMGSYYHYSMVCILLKEYAQREQSAAVDLLDECRLQLEYLSHKFGETGTTNSVLSRVTTFLDSVNK